MPIQSPQEAFLYDLSLVYAGERTGLDIIERETGEVSDGRARTLLNRQAEQCRAQMRAIEDVFASLGARPQAVRCPVKEGVRQEIDMCRQQDPTPHILTATILAGSMKLRQDDMVAYGLCLDKAIMLGELQAAQVLSTILKQEQDVAVEAERLIHEMALESIGGPETAIEVARSGGGAVPQAAARAGR